MPQHTHARALPRKAFPHNHDSHACARARGARPVPCCLERRPGRGLRSRLPCHLLSAECGAGQSTRCAHGAAPSRGLSPYRKGHPPLGAGTRPASTAKPPTHPMRPLRAGAPPGGRPPPGRARADPPLAFLLYLPPPLDPPSSPSTSRPPAHAPCTLLALIRGLWAPAPGPRTDGPRGSRRRLCARVRACAVARRRRFWEY
ncbi:MAG: hypothetical protein J3K34DRAFT_435160 [Monoraphidium minutum]|nr:MAG: hypothetical protein J3K34DRAFT_435160 [Monoraphidium minutum]